MRVYPGVWEFRVVHGSEEFGSLGWLKTSWFGGVWEFRVVEKFMV
jgi:hypothetical protein